MDHKWRILLLDTKKQNPNHYICLSIRRALEAHPDVEKITKAGYGNAAQSAIADRSNLFFAFDGEDLHRGVCERLRSLCGRAILWVTEDPYEIHFNRSNLDLFDLIFTNDSGSVAAYGAKGRHLPFAADPAFQQYPVLQERDYRYDLFFAGTAWPNRVEFMKKLQKTFEKRKVKLALPFNEHLPPPQLDLPPSAYLWKTPNSEFARLANRSRIVLTLHRSFTSSGGNARAFTPGPRLFEVALAGGFQLIDMSLPETGRYFTENLEFAGFRSFQECADKVNYYLAHHDERAKIAAAAQQRSLRDHLYDNRMKTVMDEVSKVKSGKTGCPDVATVRHRVLLVCHNRAGVHPFGGVEVYQDIIVRSLDNQFEFYLYVPDRKEPLGRKYDLYKAGRVIESFRFGEAVDDSLLSCPERERVFAGILVRYRIDIVHFHHFIGHVPSLPLIAKALGVPRVFSMNDYYPVCKYFNLIGYHGRYCNIVELPACTCDICLNAKENVKKGSQAARRSFFARVLENIDVLHVNTEGVASLFTAVYPNLIRKGNISIAGLPIPARRREETQRSSNPIHVAVLGNFTYIKGADVLLHAMNQLRSDPVFFHLFGKVVEPYNVILGHLALPNAICYGAYEPGSLFEKLKTMSLSLHMSIWPETFLITLSEAWQAGVVPIVTDIGAPGERVTHGVNGFKIPMNEPGALVHILRELLADPLMIEQVRNNITQDLYVTSGSHREWLEKHYSHLMRTYRRQTVSASASAGNMPAAGLTLSECGITLNNPSWHQTNSDNVSAVLTHARNGKHSFGKVVRYAKSHGVKATMERILLEIKNRQKSGGDRWVG